jgi:hypothetical protein
MAWATKSATDSQKPNVYGAALGKTNQLSFGGKNQKPYDLTFRKP